jgi:glycerate 2-kinase
MIIQNRAALTSQGNVRGRHVVLDIIEAGLQAADPYENTKNLLRIHDGKLLVGHPASQQAGRRESDGSLSREGTRQGQLVFDLSAVEHIYVVGGGKAAQRMAKAMEDVLGSLITEGHINAKKGEPRWCTRVEVTFAGHPIPDEASVEGSQRILAIERKAKKGDLVFLSESGGGSALMALPGPGITLEDLQAVTQTLYFEHGASMPEINAVRWQLMILRGRHGRYVGDATLLGIHTAEEPQGPRVRHWRRPRGMTAYQYAISTLKRYHVWDEVPPSVRTYLLKADPRHDLIQPGELEGKPQYHFRVMGPESMLDAAARRAAALGATPHILVASLNDMEARDAAEVVAYLAREIEFYGRPFPPPCVLLCGGELLVTVGKATGVGGRNQEFALSTAPLIEGSARIVVASIDSDGTDGPSDAAGGLVDGDTMDHLQAVGVDVGAALQDHDSFHALKALGDNLITGAQGTNVRDLRVIYIADRGHREGV